MSRVGLTHDIPPRCLSVVVPCYNEERTVVDVIDAVLEQPSVGEVLVVDDGSRDRSAELVAQVAARDERVKLLRQPRNFGKGAALRRGLSQASCPYVIVQDADLEYDPNEYPLLLSPLVSGRADVVYGSRFHSSRPHRVLYFWHSLGNQLLTLASNMATDLNLTDMETCYKVFRREVLEDVFVEEDRFGFEPEITAKVALRGWRIFEVGISYSGRTYAEGKKIGWRDGVRAMYCIARYGLLGRREVHHPSQDGGARPAPFTEADRQLQPTLETLDDAGEYAAWIESKLAPHVGGRILEVGAGRGTFTERLKRYGRVTATELSEQNLEVLRERFAGDAQVEVQPASHTPEAGSHDCAVLINVLEHIQDDVGALTELRRALKPGGNVVLWVPALPALMSDFDRQIGHFRRYERGQLMTVAYRAGLEVTHVEFVNSVGALAWWTVATQLGATPTRSGNVRLYDGYVVPWLRRVEERVQPPVGQSLFLVARVPPAS